MLQKNRCAIFLSAVATVGSEGGLFYIAPYYINLSMREAFLFSKDAMFYTYILRSASHPECRYIGYSSDLKRRFAEHNSGHVKHTAPLRPWILETYIAFESEEKARNFETYLKSGSGRAFASKHF